MNDNKIKVNTNIIYLTLLGVISVALSLLFVFSFDGGFIFKYKYPIAIISAILILFVTVTGIVSLIKNKQFIFKLSLTVLIFITAVLSLFYILKISGFFDKIHSVEELRKWVSSFGAWMPVIYIIINILQVVVLPIPGFVSVATGVALFGATLATLYSFIGIWIGSIVAYFIGKKLGYSVVKWLVGKETLDKWLEAVKNKDRIVLTFMFLFPLFPDDVLCFVAGMSSMSDRYFIIMVTVSRIITIAVTSYSLSGNLIPYDTWWGLLIWAIIIVLTVIFTIFLYKNGDKVENKVLNFIKSKFKKKNKDE